MKAHIPNAITLLNLFCGCIATVFAVRNQLDLAAFFVFLGIFFDFFDGLAARLLNAKSDIGVQLDSLADLVTSGLVPGIVLFQLLRMSETGGWNPSFLNEEANLPLIPLLGFLVTLSSAYRLAKFNVDEDQVDSFIGLPTPANALLILALPLILYYQNTETLNAIILNEWFLLGLTLVSTILLNAPIHLFSFKMGDFSFRKNAIQYLFLILAIVLLLTLGYLSIPIIILAYIIFSLVKRQIATT